MQKHAVRSARWTAICLSALVSLLLAVLVMPAAAFGAECTDTWTGPESGKWADAEDWSAERIPTETDIACIPAAHSVTVDSGAQRVKTLQGGGELVLSEASLALVGIAEASNIGALRLKSGGELGGTGELWVTEFLLGAGGLMKGDGYTELGAEATGEVQGGEFEGRPGLRVTQKRILSVHGSMSVGGEDGELRIEEGGLLDNAGSLEIHGPSGRVVLRESAGLANSGNLTVDGPEARLAAGENSTVWNDGALAVAGREGGVHLTGEAEMTNGGSLTITGTEGEVRLQGTTLTNSGEVAIDGPGGRLLEAEGALIENEAVLEVNSEETGSGIITGIASPPSLLRNTGTVAKTEGAGVSVIEVPIDNEALVKTETGILMLGGGGDSGVGGRSEWVAMSENTYTAQTRLVFVEASFSLGEEAAIAGELQVASEAEVTADGIEGDEGSFWLYGGDLHLLKGKPKALKELGVDAGTVSIDGGAELSTEYLELTESQLETAGVGELEGSAEVLIGESATIRAKSCFEEIGSIRVGSHSTFDGELFQEGGSFQLGNGVTYEGELFNEAGSFEAGDEASLSGEILWTTGRFSAGQATRLLFDEAYIVEGTAELGADSTVTGNYFWQYAGETTIGPGTSFTDEIVWLGEGTMEFGEDTTFDLSEYFFQESGASRFGADDALHARAYVHFGEGSTTLGAGAILEAEEGQFISVSATLEPGSEVTTGNLELWEGEVTGPGTMTTDEIEWASTIMAGDGRTEVLEHGVLHDKPGCGNPCESRPNYATLRERELILRGGFMTGINTLGMADGAKLVNYGELDASSQRNEWGPEIQISPESTSDPIIVNQGSFEKQTGSGTTVVDVPFRNLGHVGQREGTLSITRPLNLPDSQRFGQHCNCGDPIDASTGNITESQTDISVPALGEDLDLSRSYSAQGAVAATAPGAFGYGWTNSFGDHLTSEEGGATETLTEASGRTVPFMSNGASYVAPSWSHDTLVGGTETGFTLTLPDQTAEHFSGPGRLESVTDRNANETILAYNGSGQLETITDPSGRMISLAYNVAGLVERAEDPMGHVVKYAYESKDLKSVTLPGEATPRWQFKYDGSHRMISMIDGRGGETTNEYDGSNRVVSQTDPAGRTLAFGYEGFHTTITNEATGAVTDEWFDSNNEPSSITRGFGTGAATTESFSYDEAGELIGKTDGDGHTTTYGYDDEGNKTSERNAEGEETKRTYNEAHQVLTETQPNGEKTTIVRNANGNPETISRPAPESKTQTVSYEYGPHGEVKSMTDPLGHAWAFEYDKYGDRIAATDPEGDKRTWAYNEDSQVTSKVSPRGNEEGAEAAKFTTSIERDAQGRPIKVTDPLGGTTKTAYDADGNVESITDPNGRKTTFIYDADNELTKVERPNGAVEETGYDGAGQVASQTDGNKQKTTYVRNILEQPVEIIDPLERKTTQTFDAAGNLETKEDPNGRTTTYGYDKANRLKEISYSAEPGQDATFAYNEDSQPTSMKDGTGESTWEYDQLGRLTHSKDGNGETVAWEYNLGDQPIGLTYPNGKSISRAYDKAGRLESVTDWLGHTTSFAYNRDSAPTATTFPTATGDKDEYASDRADRMSGVTMKKGAETLASLAYSRDPAGQLESLISKGLPGAETESFSYDENERLTKAGASEYGYDAANNLTKAPGTTNAYDKASQIESVTGATFTFDKEGERTKETPSSGPATTYKYSQAGNLTAIERPEEGETPAIAESFGYDGNGLMASRTVGLSTAHLVWDPTESSGLLLSDGADSYVFGPGGLPFEQISPEEVPTYLHHDQLGSTRLLTTASGEATGTFTYGPYGVLTGHTGTATTALGYAGQYTLGQSGLQYLRVRFYDPATAQFLTLDPAVGVTREPYGYAGDSPLRFKDPTGLWFAEELGEVGIPCIFCEAAQGVQELVEPGWNAALGWGGWVLRNSFGVHELGEGDAESESSPCAQTKPSGEPNFNDPSQSPGEGWEWRGNGPQGSNEGSWYNPETGESLHPDLEHPDPIGPHYDWLPKRGDPSFRVFPDGQVVPK